MKAIQEKTMKAIVQHKYGAPDVLALGEVDKPAVGDDEVLVEVHASSVNPADWHMSTGTPYLVRPQAGLRTPKQTIPGKDVAGTIVAIGEGVTEPRVGDDVYGEVDGGAFAEYVAVRADLLAPKPANLTFEEAAAVPLAAFTALQGVRDKGQVRPGQHVLVNGASGGVGIFAVQIAKALGAEVTAVCSTKNADMVRSIGADQVIDYTKDDFSAGEQRYDVMIDNVGTGSLSDCRRVLNSDGVYVMIGGPKHRWLGPVRRMIAAMVYFRFVSQNFQWFVATPNRNDLDYLTELIEDGKVTPVIDRRYALAEVPEAMAYLGKGHTRGKSVITVSEGTGETA